MNDSGMEWLAESARKWNLVEFNLPGVTVAEIVESVEAARKQETDFRMSIKFDSDKFERLQKKTK